MPEKKLGKTYIIIILGALTTISPFTIDMYLPAFKLIAQSLNTTPEKISLSVSSYFIGFSIGQLLYGPLLDRFGRKRPLYFGLGLYAIACFACMQAHTVTQLVIFRFFQALGGCVSTVAAMAMVRDFFPVKESAKVFSLLVLMIALSPLFAPTVGGFITAWLGWQWIFMVLLIIAVIILAVSVIFLPEGHKPDTTISLKPAPMLQSFYKIVINRQFITYALASAFGFAVLFVYVAGSPIIFMQVFHVSPQTYGLIFAGLSIGFIGANQLNILILRKYNSQQIFRAGVISQVICCTVFIVGASLHWFDITGTLIMIFFCIGCLGFINPNAQALALAPFAKNAGSASALIGFLQIGIGGAISASISFFPATSSVPSAMLMIISSALALLILLIGGRGLKVELGDPNDVAVGAH